MNKSILLAALMAIALSACGKKEEVAAPAPAPVAAPAAPAQEAAPAAEEAPAEEKAADESESNLSFNAALVSDYVFRGISQNNFEIGRAHV